MRAAVGIMARLPRPGRTKTRLASEVGAEDAVALHEAFAHDEIDALERGGFEVFLLHDTPASGEEALAERLAAGHAHVALCGGDLASDLAQAFRLLGASGQPVAIVSGDVPQLRADDVRDALARLADADVVFGPCPDGGYWLVAMRKPQDLFHGVAMGTSVALAQTATRARSLGLRVALGRELRDVDRAEDLRAVMSSLPAAARTRTVVSRLGFYAKDAPPLPVRLHLELTNRCAYDCATCARRALGLGDPARDLSTADVLRIIGDLPHLRTVALQVNGESLVHPWLGDILRLLRSRGIAAELNTMGLLLDSRRRGIVIDQELALLCVSLDAATPETYRAVRGEDFGCVVENLRAVIDERRARRASDPRVSLWMTVTRRNVAEIPALVLLAAEVGADEVYLQRLVVTGKGLATNDQSLHGRNLPEVKAVLAEATRHARRLGVALAASGGVSPTEMLRACDSQEPWRACRRPFESAAVLADGDVVPCCIATFIAPRQEIRMGNVLRDGWAAVWEGERYTTLRDGLASDRAPTFCRSCGLRWSL